jgi:hypothetical protein
MTDRTAEWQVCRKCRAELGGLRVTITEQATTTTAISEWTFCSWACARDLVVRMDRLGRLGRDVR